MSTLSGLISSGGGALPQISLTQSQTFVPPQDGNICIHVIGAGGAGSGLNAAVYSGGAGGYSKKNTLAVTTSGSFTVVVGVGGSGGSGVAGTAGGNSTVAGTGLSSTLTANGGGAGTASGVGAGGSSSNGDVNNTGGAGTVYGGGAVGIYGTGAVGAGSSGALARQGGSSDAQGGISGFGHIAGGGKGGKYRWSNSGMSEAIRGDDGGDFAGGGVGFGTVGFCWGGDGGTGAGGGGGQRSSSDPNSCGGNGGDGLVLIQYLPS